MNALGRTFRSFTVGFANGHANGSQPSDAADDGAKIPSGAGDGEAAGAQWRSSVGEDEAVWQVGKEGGRSSLGLSDIGGVGVVGGLTADGLPQGSPRLGTIMSTNTTNSGGSSRPSSMKDVKRAVSLRAVDDEEDGTGGGGML